MKKQTQLPSFESLIEEKQKNLEMIKSLTERNKKIDGVIESVKALGLKVKEVTKISKAYKPYKDSKPDKILKILADGRGRTARIVAIELADGGNFNEKQDVKLASSLLNWLIRKGRVMRLADGKYRLKYAPKPKEEVEESKPQEAKIGHDTKVISYPRPTETPQ